MRQIRPIGRPRGWSSLSISWANESPSIQGRNKDEGIVNYFIGNDPEKWRSSIPTYREVVYNDIYPGIDLRLYSKEGELRYDFVVNPGAHISDIELAYHGVDSLVIEAGELVVATAFGQMKQSQPYIYEEIGDEVVEVDGNFELVSRNTYGFGIAAYDASCPLVIDPCLAYSTYVGGTDDDNGTDIAVDSSGCAYITGWTYSNDFPILNAYQADYGGGLYDVFVTKLNASGNGLLYSTYLGGDDKDCGDGIAVDSSGCAYVTGYAFSNDFPTTVDAYQRERGGPSDAFATKLNPTGSGLVYSTYIGGSGWEHVGGIAVDLSGCAYVAGATWSANFPVQNAYQTDYVGGASQADAFVTKLNPTGSTFVYSTFLGGGSPDSAIGIAIDSADCAYITGRTWSDDFPTTADAFQRDRPRPGYGASDTFVTKLNAAGDALVYSTYLGGTEQDMARDIAVGPSGCAYVTGSTMSDDFPTTAGALQDTDPDPAHPGSWGSDAFVSKIDPTQSGAASLVYSTYLGGTYSTRHSRSISEDSGIGIAVDSSGCAYVTGCTWSEDFPTENPFQNTHGGGSLDAFVTKVNASGDALDYSTYIGGDSNDIGRGIALDLSRNVYIDGDTASTDFPTVNAYQVDKQGGVHDVLLAKIDMGTLNNSPSIPSNPSPGNDATGVSGAIELSWSGGDPDPGDTVTYEVYFGTSSTPPLVSDNQAATTCDPGALSSNTRYYWRIIAVDNHGAPAFGPRWTFFTCGMPPSVTTDNVTDITATSARLNGNLTSLGTASSANVTFQWSTTSGSWSSANVTAPQVMNTTGTFSSVLGDLEPGTTYYVRAKAVGDGIGYGDEESFATHVNSATGTGGVSFSCNIGSISLTAVSEATVPAAGKPDVIFNDGLFSLNISDLALGSTVTVTITLPAAVPVGTEYWKYDPVEGWVDVTWLMGDDDGDNVLTLTLTDGGPGDGDGIPNGTIVDPGGPGVPAAAPPPGPGGGGGGGGGWKPPTHRMMSIDTLGRRTSAKISYAGELLEPLTLADADNRFTLKFDEGTKILCGSKKAPERIELRLGGSQPSPGDATIVGAAYEVNGYAYEHSSTRCAVSISPPATMRFAYAPDELPDNTTSLTIAYYDGDKGWVELETSGPGLTKAGMATAEVDHFAAFALLAQQDVSARFEISDLSMSPVQAQPEQEVRIGVRLANTGGIAGSYDAVLRVNGRVEETKTIKVGPGSALRVEFAVQKGKPGTYTVDIAGQRGSFIVVGGGREEGSGWGGGLIVSAAVVVLVLLAGVLVVVARRRFEAN